MAGIPQTLHQQIRQALLACDELYDADQLRALFAVEELRPFRSRLKIARSGDAQVDLLISDLLYSQRATGENALVLFLQVVGRRYDSNHALHVELLELADQVQNTLGGDKPVPVQADHKPTDNDERTHLQKLLAQQCRNLQHLELQQSHYGAGEEPLHLLNQLTAVRETIKGLQQQLAE